MQEQNAPQAIDLKTLEENIPEKLHPILEFVVNNLKAIGLAVGALLLVVGAYAGYQTWTQNAVQKEQAALGEIVVTKRGDARIAALESFSKTATGAAENQALFELARAAMEAKQYDKAVEAFDKLSASVTPDMGMTVKLGKIKAQMLAGQYPQALTELLALKDSAPEYYTVLIAQFTAISAEQSQNWVEAIRAYSVLKSRLSETESQYLQAKIKELEAKI